MVCKQELVGIATFYCGNNFYSHLNRIFYIHQCSQEFLTPYITYPYQTSTDTVYRNYVAGENIGEFGEPTAIHHILLPILSNQLSFLILKIQICQNISPPCNPWR